MAKGSKHTPYLDSLHVQEPFRDQKHFFGHFYPYDLCTILIRNALVEVLDQMSKVDAELPLDLPRDDCEIVLDNVRSALSLGPRPARPATLAVAKRLGWFVVKRLWVPVVKDLGTISATRYYEYLFARYFAPRDNVLAGRFSRGE